MALTPEQLTALHRREQLLLRRATIAQMRKLWPALDWANLDKTYPKFALEVAKLVAVNRDVSSSLAAQYLRAFRIASGLSGDVTIVNPLLNAEQLFTALKVTSVVAAKTSAANGIPADVAMRNALAEASGAMARMVLNGGRETVLDTVQYDDAATGWRRVLGAGGCEFCRMLAGRGTVYKSESTADFGAHDHCGCTVEPSFGGYSKQVRTYTASEKFKTQESRDANNQRIREYLAANA